MPDITSSTAVRNSSAVLTMNAATASQTINVGDVADERAAIVVNATQVQLTTNRHNCTR